MKQEVSTGAVGDNINPASKDRLKGTLGMEQDLIQAIPHHEGKKGKCYNQFLAGFLQSHPLNVTLQQCPITEDFPYIQQRSVDVSQAMDSDLRCTELLCEEACFNTLKRYLELHELCKKTRSRADTHLIHRKPIGSHGQMQ